MKSAPAPRAGAKPDRGTTGQHRPIKAGQWYLDRQQARQRRVIEVVKYDFFRMAYEVIAIYPEVAGDNKIVITAQALHKRFVLLED